MSTKTNQHSLSTRRFLLMRLHSLAGVVPLGLFLLEHLYSNAVAMLGEAAYNRQIAWLHAIPFVGLIELVFIAPPLLYHAGYGMYIAALARSNALSYSYRNNWLFLFQRISGILTLVFILYHLWQIRLAALFFDAPVDFHQVQQHLAHPLVWLFYAAGSVAATFHFTNGIAAALVAWGVTRSPRSQAAASRVSMGLFLALSVIWIMTLLAF